MAKKFKCKQFYNFNGKILDCWSRRNGSALLLSKSVYRAREAFDLREWVHIDDDKFRATKRGLRLSPSEPGAVYAAIKRLKEEIEQILHML
jgi:hypothetical protein